MNQNENIIRLCRNLAALLEDPHPGLFTWCEFRARTATELRDALAEALGPTREPPENKPETCDICGAKPGERHIDPEPYY